MTIVVHELRQGFKAFLIWTISIAALMVVCVFMFPEMEGQMDDVSDMFASMGSFTSAFGMDRLNFGTFIGFYAIECGNIVGLGGAMFSALISVTILAKEENNHTSEFLFTHPISRKQVVTEKLLSVFIEIIVLNLVVYLLTIVSVVMIDCAIPWKELTLLHLAYLLMQFELAGICFGISAFVRYGSMGIGLGLASVFYFLNIVANISDKAKFLKYITPFGYTEGADIVSDGCLNTGMILLGFLYAAVFIALGYWHYCRKDLRN